MWKVYDNNNDDKINDDWERTNFEQKSSGELKFAFLFIEIRNK